MFDKPTNVRKDRRAVRHEATKAEIVSASWALVRRNGLSGLALRDLASAVDMKAPSLYSYFASKNDIYDAMFAEGYLAFGEHLAAIDSSLPPAERARAGVRVFFEFCVADPVRFQLLFQRTIPDFVPSPQSYALAVAVYEQLAAQLAALGVTDPQAMDLWTAVTTGLVSQQIANDPGGNRWERLIDRSVDMLLAATVPSAAGAAGRNNDTPRAQRATQRSKPRPKQ